MNKRYIIAWLCIGLTLASCSITPKQENALCAEPIDRTALLERNSPVVTRFDSLESLTVGNGCFAFTVDASGMQTFPEQYAKGIPLGTMSDWGWHVFANTDGFRFSETLVEEDFGRGHTELYASQPREHKDAANYFRMNPHRLHLGTVGLALPDTMTSASFSDIEQRLDLQNGIITSTYKLRGEPVKVMSCVHPTADRIAIQIEAETPKSILMRMPYPTGKHSDDACMWNADSSLHYTYCYRKGRQADDDSGISHLIVVHQFAEADYSYQVDFAWNRSEYGDIYITRRDSNSLVINTNSPDFAFTCQWSPCQTNPYNSYALHEPRNAGGSGSFDTNCMAARNYWNEYWEKGGMVDFSGCSSPDAAELERRIVLSQYLLAVNCAGKTPPQETGLTYNSWFGKYHLEMIWWHQAQFALFGHPELLERSLDWYMDALPEALMIAERQGFSGARWIKMTDPTAKEAPSSVGSYLLWQQPHFIYLAELVRRAREARGEKLRPEQESMYYELIRETADFMCDVVSHDTLHNLYGLHGLIPAQETLKAHTTVNPPFELAQWYFTLGIANQWALRREGHECDRWREVQQHLAPLHAIYDEEYSATYGTLYPASADAIDTYHNDRLTSDHMAVLGALGVFPASPLVADTTMRHTLYWVRDHWHWEKTWGWDHPMTAMCAARLNEPQVAVDALLAPHRTNTYLSNGHNYQDERLRLYLPGNGALLSAIALMCAGWDGLPMQHNPGFPDDGQWNVRWEGILPMP